VVSFRSRFDRNLLSQTRKTLLAQRPDIVQTHSYRPAAVVAWARLLRPRWKWVAFFHGVTAENLRVRMFHAMDRVLSGRADRVVVVSSSQVARFRRHGAKVRVVHNAILPDSEGPEPTLPGNVPVTTRSVPRLAVIGRLSREKGVDLFLQALSQVKTPFLAHVAGDGPDRTHLARMASQLGLGDRVVFLGRVSPIGPVYRWADLVVIPSRSEGMPNVLLEAIQHQRFVVATDVGNIREIIGGTPLGIVVPPGSPSALARGIDTAMATSESADRGAERTRVLREYSLDRRVRNHVALYRELVDS
jgi:glycosyltransferase involved in cell wall biosynthesis